MTATGTRTSRTAWPRPRGEGGSAVVEFLLLSIVLLIPLVYLTLMVARLQAGTFATTVAAREAARAFVTSPTQAAAAERATAAAGLTYANFSFEPEETDLEITCTASPCLQPGATVTVRAEVIVPLPLIPTFVRDLIPLQVPVSTEHAFVVDRFRSTPP